MMHRTRTRLGLAAVLSVLAFLLLASCTSEINLGSKSEATGSTLPAQGGISGGVLSGAIGANLGEEDRQRAYAAEVQALESGEPGIPVGWRGDGPKLYGTVVPGAPYSARGTRCRDYSHSIYVDGKPQIARGTACRNPDGSWSPVG
jgi:surface antigen